MPEKISKQEIHFAPLQGYTDQTYRRNHFLYVGDVDFYYTPYFSVDSKLSFAQTTCPPGLFDLTVPQILPANIDELKILLKFITENNFRQVNINLGCPYPMVTRKGRGAALILKPLLVKEMISWIADYSELTISLKTRLGLTDPLSVFDLFEKLDSSKTGSVIIHPRTAKQLYKGKASREMYIECKTRFPDFDMIYNGDITSFDDFTELDMLLKGQKKWMIGRGLLSNPFLGWQIKNGNSCLPYGAKEKFSDFIFSLISNIETESNNEGLALNKLKNQFEYLSNFFADQVKAFRVIRKSCTLLELKKNVDDLIYTDINFN